MFVKILITLLCLYFLIFFLFFLFDKNIPNKGIFEIEITEDEEDLLSNLDKKKLLVVQIVEEGNFNDKL